jgi:hypothetical protein
MMMKKAKKMRTRRCMEMTTITRMRMARRKKKRGVPIPMELRL